MTIDEFLSARLDELEAPDGLPHDPYCSGMAVDDSNGYEFRGDLCDCGWPAYVLADVAAKREIVKDYRAAQYNPRPFNSVMARAAALTWVVKYLAQPYAEHPDFSPEWKTP